MVNSMEHLKKEEYYDYIVRKVEELDLSLDPEDVDVIVKRYEEELALESNIFEENDALLFKIIKELLEEAAKELPEVDDSYYDLLLMERTSYERTRFNKGGHGFGDSYDDQGLDELEQEGPIL